MIGKDEIASIIEDYDRLKLRVGMTASHSALDICDGAIEEGFPTVAYCQKGREKTYSEYFKTQRTTSGRVRRGMVDKSIVLDSFNDVMNPEMQNEMRKRNVVYIPNRSFTSYSSIDDVENNFHVPMFGSRNMLRMEERTEDQDYYWILDKAGLPYPEAIEDPQDIDCLVIVKLHHAQKKLERGFFTCASYEEYVEKSRIRKNFPTEVESLNWLEPKASMFQYHWSLYSAGHAELDVNKDSPKEDMIRNRDRNNSGLLGDSGGFQIGKGVWEGDWKDPNCPKAKKKREQVLTWMDAYMDYGMILDIPAWVSRSPAGAKAYFIDLKDGDNV